MGVRAVLHTTSYARPHCTHYVPLPHIRWEADRGSRLWTNCCGPCPSRDNAPRRQLRANEVLTASSPLAGAQTRAFPVPTAVMSQLLGNLRWVCRLPACFRERSGATE